MHVYKYIYICISIIVNTKLYAQVDNLIKDHQSENPVKNMTKPLAFLLSSSQKTINTMTPTFWKYWYDLSHGDILWMAAKSCITKWMVETHPK
jgi:hypothetical protein